jgi:hypothetical protein
LVYLSASAIFDADCPLPDPGFARRHYFFANESASLPVSLHGWALLIWADARLTPFIIQKTDENPEAGSLVDFEILTLEIINFGNY